MGNYRAWVISENFRLGFGLKLIIINIIKFEQKILEYGLHSRIMSKPKPSPRLTENSKRRRVEIAEENVEFAIRVWRRTIFIDKFSYETGPKGQFRIRRSVGTRDDPENIIEIQNSGWSSVLCCVCFLYTGLGPLTRSVGHFNSD